MQSLAHAHNNEVRATSNVHDIYRRYYSNYYPDSYFDANSRFYVAQDFDYCYWPQQ